MNKIALNSFLNISRHFTTLFAVALGLQSITSATEGDDIRAATNVNFGLAIHIGTSDGQLESQLADTGQFLVHGLTDSQENLDDARKTATASGTEGLATFQYIKSFGTLPYPDHLANLVVVNLDRLGGRAPGEAEVKRILAPGGAAFLIRGGKPSVLRKDMPAEFDDWQQYWYGATGNPVSKDRAVAPPTGLQWIGGIHSEGTMPQNGYRISAGKAVYEAKLDRDHSAMFCRDAFNGLIRWSHQFSHKDRYPHFKSKPLINVDGRIFTVMADNEGMLVEIDSESGEVIRRFEAGGRTARSDKRHRHDPGIVTNLVHHGGVLIQTAGPTVYALGLDGDLRWKAEVGGDLRLDFPTIDPQDGRVYVASSPIERWKRGSRNPKVEAEAVIALDLKSGKELWRTPLKGKQVSQLVYDDGALYLYEAMPIGHDEFSMQRLDASTGESVWKYEGDKGSIGQKLEMIVRGERIYLMSHGVAVFDKANGKLLEQWKYGVNARCDSSRATEDLLLLAYGNLAKLGADDSAAMTHQRIARSSCASGAFPAYGMMYFLPTACGCESWLRGHLALHSRPLPKEDKFDDPDRLQKGGAFGEKLAGRIEPDSWPTFRHDSLKSAATNAKIPGEPRVLWQRKVTTVPDKSSITSDWSLTNDPTRHAITAPTVAHGLVFVSVPHAHNLVALDALTGEQRWTYVLEGRPDSPPVVSDGICFLNTRHGNVYAIRADDGALVWCYRAAPAEYFIVAYGAMESAWPAFGSPVVVDDGRSVIVSSGRHPEAGGIHLYKLNAKSGEVLAHKSIHSSHPWQPADEKGFQTPMNDIVNLALAVDTNGILHIPGVAIDPKTLEISAPEDTAGEILWYTVYTGTGATRAPAADIGALTYFGKSALSHNASINGMGSRLGVLGARIAIEKPNVYAYGLHGRKDWNRYEEVGKAQLGEDGMVDSKVWGQEIPLNPAALIKTANHIVVTGVTKEQRDAPSEPIILTIPEEGGIPHRVNLPSYPVAEGLAAALGKIYVALEDGGVICFGN